MDVSRSRDSAQKFYGGRKIPNHTFTVAWSSRVATSSFFRHHFQTAEAGDRRSHPKSNQRPMPWPLRANNHQTGLPLPLLMSHPQNGSFFISKNCRSQTSTELLRNLIPTAPRLRFPNAQFLARGFADQNPPAKHQFAKGDLKYFFALDMFAQCG